MTTSLQALLGESLDYAGLFPPAELPLEKALHNYLAYQNHSQSWMLARFVCPLARLAELESLLPKELTRPLRLSVLGRLDKRGDAMASRLQVDLDQIVALRTKQGERVRIEQYESRLPAEEVVNYGEIQERFLTAIGGISVFLEGTGGPKSQPDTYSDFLASSAKTSVTMGRKIRLGGVDSTALPSPSDVAEFIVACRDAGSNWKATAGLHQPFWARDAERGTYHFGFLSLFAAAVLARVYNLRADQVVEMLEDTNGFRFENDHFAWRNLSATVQQIAAARKNSLISFGSCSFEEPIAGLEERQLLGSGVSHE